MSEITYPPEMLPSPDEGDEALVVFTLSNGHAAVVRRGHEDEGASFIAEVPTMPGCLADGDTIEDAMAVIELAAQEWWAAAKAVGRIH